MSDCRSYPTRSGIAPRSIRSSRPWPLRTSLTTTPSPPSVSPSTTYTGITDNDRALTIRTYADVLFSGKPIEEIQKEMGINFRAPGHVHLLNTSENILENRKGHTELCTALMIMAGVKPCATICEMMGDDGNAKSKAEVLEYAEKNGMTFITGDEIIAAWKEFKSQN